MSYAQQDVSIGDFYCEVLNLVARDVGSPRSCEIATSYGVGLIKEIATAKSRPGDYQAALPFFEDHVAVELLRKAADLPVDMDPRGVAKLSYQTAELRCARTNARLSKFRNRPIPWNGFEQVLFLARKKIGFLLKDFSYSEALKGCSQGSGSTVSIKLEDAGHDTKFDESRISCSSDALPIFRAVSACSGWAHARGIPASGPCSLLNGEFNVVAGDVVEFVPKSAKTYRGITKGPTAGIFLQLGIGDYLRKCLLRAHIDIKDQGVNQGLARNGSIFDTVATIDLESASDTLATETVKLLLPEPVFDLLDMVRSKMYTLDGETHLYHKFVAQGNGFTFPLQTLVYWGLCVAVCEEQGLSQEQYVGWTGVFGDDIIVPSCVAARLVEVLSFLGFVVNEGKSYVEGNYRESCGGQFFGGKDVKPMYWNGFQSSHVTPWEIAKFAHALFLLEDRASDLGGTTMFRRTLAYLERLYNAVCSTGKFGRAARQKPPMVYYKYGPGLGFPVREYTHTRTVWVWTFQPLTRPGRDIGVYAAYLYNLSKRPAKVESPSEWLTRIRSAESNIRLGLDVETYKRSIDSDADLPYSGLITVPKRGRYRLRRRVLYPHIVDYAR